MAKTTIIIMNNKMRIIKLGDQLFNQHQGIKQGKQLLDCFRRELILLNKKVQLTN